jgi:hypothetical protein
MRLRYTSITISSLFLVSLTLVIIAIGFRPETVGSDTPAYLNHYEKLILDGTADFRYDYLFEIMARFFSVLGFPSQVFFTCFAVINFICLFLLAQTLTSYFENQSSFWRIFSLLISLLCLSPFFLSAQVNVIRHGTSIFFLLLSYVLWLDRSSFLKGAIAIALAQSFHHVTVFYAVFIPILYFSYATILRCTFFAATVYTLGLGQYLIHRFVPGIYDKIINYGAYSGYSGYQLGARYEFVAFTLGAGMAFHWIGKNFLNDVHQKKFYGLLKIYWILTIPFFIFGFGTYSDRYLLPAWIYLSVLATAVMILSLNKLKISIYWYYVVFLLSTSCLLLKAQGVIG